MLHSLLSLPVEAAVKLDEYAIRNSPSISSALKKHYDWTVKNFPDADRASSLLQAQWMLQTAKDVSAKRVLDIGCYTGLSAVAWYEGTLESQAQIITIERNAVLAAKAKASFAANGFTDRIELIAVEAQEAIATLSGGFDVIFLDVEFSAYLPLVKQILDSGLLSKNGVILVDNVFARGFAIADQVALSVPDHQDILHWNRAGQLVRDFNAFLAADSRVDVIVLPIFDGISQIRLKADAGDAGVELMRSVL